MIVPRRPDSLSPFHPVRLIPRGLRLVELVSTIRTWAVAPSGAVAFRKEASPPATFRSPLVLSAEQATTILPARSTRLSHRRKPLALGRSLASCFAARAIEASFRGRPTTACSGRNLAALGFAAEACYVGQTDALSEVRRRVGRGSARWLRCSSGQVEFSADFSRKLQERYRVVVPVDLTPDLSGRSLSCRGCAIPLITAAVPCHRCKLHAKASFLRSCRVSPTWRRIRQIFLGQHVRPQT